MIKISIIIPIYNVEKYLRQCLDSVINQTLEDIEIICIDDGSTDNCGQIIDKYASIDRRIVAIHKENGGYASAINKGIDIAKGEFIGIVESDDFCINTMFEDMYNAICDSNADYVMSDFYYYESVKKDIKPYSYSEKMHFEYKIDKKNIKYFNLHLCPEIINCPGFPWKNLYRKSFLDKNNIRLIQDGNGSYEDIVLNATILACAEKILYLNKPLYYYRVLHNEASSSNGKKTMINYLTRRKQARDILYDKNLFKDDVKEYFYYILLRGSCEFFKKISIKYKELFYNEMQKIFNLYKQDEIMFKYFPIESKQEFYAIVNKNYLEYKKWKYWKDFNKNVVGIYITEKHIQITIFGIKISLKRKPQTIVTVKRESNKPHGL